MPVMSVDASNVPAGAWLDAKQQWSGGALGPVPSSFMLLYPKALLLCCEAGNHQLMALLRDSWASEQWGAAHGIQDARVSCVGCAFFLWLKKWEQRCKGSMPGKFLMVPQTRIKRKHPSHNLAHCSRPAG
jgi:hypothetical protein